MSCSEIANKKRNFAGDAKETAQRELNEAQVKHALMVGRRYMRFCREANGANAARYTLAEYLRLQGVNKVFISAFAKVLEDKYALV